MIDNAEPFYRPHLRLETMTVVTRFAPSPTGFLHIGGARTALFNWLYARHHGGRFQLRIEDTDRERSTPEAVDAIIEGLGWLELDWDGETVFQSSRRPAHAATAEKLLAGGNAYHCYATPEELEAMRAQARAESRPMRYDGRWRDRDPAEAPAGVPPVVRFKAPQDGDTVIEDRVQGEVRFANAQLDDMVLLRADGTPTYMLSVVVDDHDMAITHVIRGADHLTNAARQANLFTALGWEIPIFAHVPLIHGPDGARLSKRHGALGVSAYQEKGYLPQALRNYLVRLGWSHGDDEIFSTEQAVAWFDLAQVGRSAARFDLAKLTATNAHYLKAADTEDLVELMIPELEKGLGRAVEESDRKRLTRALPELKERAKTISELCENAEFYVMDGLPEPDEKAHRLLDPDACAMLGRLVPRLEALETWDGDELEANIRTFAEAEGVKLGAVAQPLRAALTGRTTSPPIFGVMAILGRETTISRLLGAISPP